MSALLLVTELEDYTISYANGLSRHMPVTLAVPRRRYQHLAGYFEAGVDLRLLDWPRHRSLSNLSFLVALSRLIRRERPQVIHLLCNTTLWLNLAAPFWRGMPFITTVHDVEMHPGDTDTAQLPRWASTLIVRQSDEVIVHGKTLKGRAEERFGKTPDRVHVLSHPSIPRYAELARNESLSPAPRSGFNLLMFGRIFAYKGLDQLLRAEALLGRRVADLRITIAGRGDDPATLRHLMGDPGRYEILNRFIEDREVAQLFLNADAVVLPYTEASQSGVLNVAAAFGKPVIVTDVGELGQTVRACRAGIVVPPNDAAALARAIERLATRPALRAALGRRARAWAEGPNAPAAVGAEAASLYRRLIQKRRGGHPL